MKIRFLGLLLCWDTMLLRFCFLFQIGLGFWVLINLKKKNWLIRKTLFNFHEIVSFLKKICKQFFKFELLLFARTLVVYSPLPPEFTRIHLRSLEFAKICHQSPIATTKGVEICHDVHCRFLSLLIFHTSQILKNIFRPKIFYIKINRALKYTISPTTLYKLLVYRTNFLADIRFKDCWPVI